MSGFIRREIDTEPHPIFAVYSAGNFAEVAPPRWSPMSWSLVGDPVERGLRGLVAKLWPSARWQTGSRYVFVGYFACRPYHNLSAFAHITNHTLGLNPRELTASYFEGIAPPARAAAVRVGRLDRAGVFARAAQVVARFPARLAKLEARIFELEGDVRGALAAGSSPARWLAVAQAKQLLDEVWALHYDITALSIAIRALQRALGSRVLPWWEEAEAWIARPTELAWAAIHDAAAAQLGHGEFLKFPFYEVADAHEPWATIAGDHPTGASPADPPPLEHDPVEALWSMLPRRRLFGLRNAVTLVEDMMRSRERSKILAMRTLHVYRLLLPHLAQDAGIAEDLWPYLTVHEMTEFHHHDHPNDRARARRELCTAALAEPMPDQLALPTVTAPTVAPPSRSSIARGRGVSRGLVSGVVVSKALEPTDGAPAILVCDRADVDIQHLLGRIGGLVTARGSALSHVAVLVREYGIPAVVASPLAATLQPGDRIAIDGTTGEVRQL